MALTEQQKEIALRVAYETARGPNDVVADQGFEGYFDDETKAFVIDVFANFLAALPNPEPVAYLFEDEGGERYWYPSSNPQPFGIKVYTEAPFTPPANKQSPIAWATTNEDGDYAMLFFDKQEARSYSGDDEPVGLAPVSLSEPKPDYKAQRDALLELIHSAVEELREMKQVIGFRTNTLEVIEKCDAAVAAAKGA